VLPPYKPWWAVPEEITSTAVADTMKVAELKEECEKLGVSSKGKKDELLQLLRETKALYDLSDANFRQVTIPSSFLSPSLLLLVTFVSRPLLPLCDTHMFTLVFLCHPFLFCQPTFVQCGTQRPSCYPEVYEEVGAAGELSSKAFSSFKAPPQAGDNN